MSRRGSAIRTLGARLGLVAVLFQAVLSGWHHHEPRFADRLPAPIVENQAAAPQLADDEDGCEICQVLHHLTAAPVGFAAVPPPLAIAVTAATGEAVFAARTPSLAFHARAPPLA